VARTPSDEMLELAKAIVLREQDVAAREHDVIRRKQELDDRLRELDKRKGELRQLRFDFGAIATGDGGPSKIPNVVASTTSAAPSLAKAGPSLARGMATIAERVLPLLEMEPRAFSPSEIFNLLELPPPIETLRTTLWKMAQRGLIARPFSGVYCARQYEEIIMRGSQNAG
jgi:hypothetical protein